MKVRKSGCVLLVLLLLLSLSACGAKSEATGNSMNYYADKAPMEMAPGAAEYGLTQDSQTTAGTALPEGRKMIRTIDISAETEDLTTLTEELTGRVAQLGGYVESKNLHNGSNYASYRTRSLSMTVRIPAEKADEFISRVSEQANVVSSAESVDDVTLTYVDTESHVAALETEQARLLELLEKAESLKDILEIESRLTDVRYELERYASQLRTLDNQVNYATIRLSVTEVKEYTPVHEEQTLWQRISEGFGRSLKDIGSGFTDLMVWIAVNSPYLLLLALGAGILILLLRRRFRGKKPLRREPPAEDTQP